MPDEKVYLNYRPGDTSFILRVPFSKKDRAKKIGGVWDQAAKGWRFPVDAGLWQQIRQAFGGNGDLLVDRAFLDKLQAVEDNQRRFAEMKRLAEEDNPIDFEVPGIALNGKNPLFNYQKWGVKCAAMAEDGFLIGDVMGLGKAEVVDNRVFTPEGRKRIGDLKPGDRVIGSDGKPTRVTAVYPQGVLDIFELTFSDGSTIKCSGEHLWTVYDHRDDCPRTFTVNEMLDQACGDAYYKDAKGRGRWRLPLVREIYFEVFSHSSPVNPHLLGILLGNDAEGAGATIRALAEIGLDDKIVLAQAGIGRDDKFIPDEYKYGESYERRRLLQGLFETLGDDKNPAELRVPSRRLALDIKEVIETLGGVARLCPERPKDGAVAYRLKTSIPYGRAFDPDLPHGRAMARILQDIRPAGKAECVCIAVDAPDHLYVTEHCLVTHNTIQGIATAILRRQRGEISNCLVICPASLKYNWLDEIAKFTTERALVIDGTAKERRQKWMAAGYFFKIANYETIVNDLFVPTDPRVKARKAPLPVDEIAFRKYMQGANDMLLLDEIHACKHYESQRTQAVKQLRAKYRLGLSGTPIDGRLEELHSIFQFLKPGLFENRRLFLEKHAQFDGFGRVTGYFNVQEVRDRIAPYYLRRLKENVLKDLPPKLFKDIYVELPKPEMGVYKDLIRGAHEITEEAEAITRLMRVRQFLDFPEIIDLHNPSAKFEALSALLEELVYGNGEKAIVFTQYKEALDRIVKNLAGRYRIAQIHGGIGAKERVEIVKDFNESKTLQLLVGTDAMSTGLNIGGAHAVIHYEDSFSPAIMQQRNDRAHRATTRHTVTVYRFVCVGTVEEKFRRALGDKMDLNNRVLDENCGEFGSTGLRAIDILKYL